MFQKSRMLGAVLLFAGTMFAWLLNPVTVSADSAGDILGEDSVGASIVFNPTAYNEASSENLGIEITELISEDELSALVMANVKSVLNIREEASTDSKIVGKLYKDCGGTVLERGEVWSKIQTGDVIGWCKNEFLYFDEEAIEVAKDVGTTSAIINEDCVAVREESNEESAVIGYASEEAVFEVIKEENGWIGIAYGEYDGFVKSELVELDFEIDHGESMDVINERKAAERALKNSVAYKKQQIKDDNDDLRLLASIIWCEARGEPYEGMVAVGEVVLNRVNSPAYPDTIFGVIFASGQFSPVKSGSIYKAYKNNANPVCYMAAQAALDGVSVVGNVTHFRRVGTKVGQIIGHHVFY